MSTKRKEKLEKLRKYLNHQKIHSENSLESGMYQVEEIIETIRDGLNLKEGRS